MAIRTYKVTLDSKNTIAPEPVYLRQGDKTGAVVIDATLMDNGSPVSLSGLTPMFKANTADGQAVIADSTGFNIVNASGGEFTYQVPSALSSVPGKITTAYFSLSDKSGIQSTFDVTFIIKKAVDITQKAVDYITTIGAIGVKGVYNNLQALISAKPDGDIGIYVTADTGHWFFWNGTTWQDGGKFQASGLDDESLNKFKKEVLDEAGKEVLDQTNAMRTSLNNHQQELNEHESELKINRTDIQDIQGVGSLKNIELVDENGNRIVDNNAVGISGQRWLINTDKTLSQDDLPADAKAVGDWLNDQQSELDGRLNDQQSELDRHESELKLDRTDIQDIRGVGSLKDIELLDGNGNRIVDNNGVGISGQRWLINTDKTLSQDDLPADAKAVGEALITKPDAYGIPILYLYGDGIPSLKTKTDSLSAGISYSFPRFNISGNLKKIKVQGSSSANLAKKNYTLQFDQSVELITGYGKQNKYVIKANMTDFSHVRNTGCAKLWGKVRETRITADDAIKINDTDYLVDNSGNHIVGESDPQLSIGGTYGAIDGFPIAVYINNQYWGLYSFNIPKDAWLAKMPNQQNHAIVSAFWTTLNKTTQLDGTDMEIEFCGTHETGWVLNSINALINKLISSYTSVADFDNAVSGSLDINSAIDYYVYSVAIDNTDGFMRNYLLQTWDSKKWYVAPYDLDMTFGRTPSLFGWMSPVYNGDDNRNGGITLTNLAGGNRLFYQLWKFHKEDIIARYKELVTGPLSSGAVSTLLTNFAVPIPDALLDQEDKTWPQTSFSGTNNLSQIRWWYMEHTNFITNSIANV